LGRANWKFDVDDNAIRLTQDAFIVLLSKQGLTQDQIGWLFNHDQKWVAYRLRVMPDEARRYYASLPFKQIDWRKIAELPGREKARAVSITRKKASKPGRRKIDPSEN
jgi:hypothetical protein